MRLAMGDIHAGCALKDELAVRLRCGDPAFELPLYASVSGGFIDCGPLRRGDLPAGLTGPCEQAHNDPNGSPFALLWRSLMKE